MITGIALATTLAVAGNSAQTELSSSSLMPPIIADLKRALPDAYSIREFILCPAIQVKYENGRPTRLTVRFAFNSKNSSGGYTGLTPYAAGFKNGVITLHSFSMKLGGDGALDQLINRKMLDRMMNCEAISDAAIQELLAKPVSREARP